MCLLALLMLPTTYPYPDLGPYHGPDQGLGVVQDGSINTGPSPFQQATYTPYFQPSYQPSYQPACRNSTVTLPARVLLRLRVWQSSLITFIWDPPVVM